MEKTISTAINVASPPTPRSATIAVWEPEDPHFWNASGQRIATRNLWVSVPALLLAFSVWMMFAVVAVKLPQIGFKFSENQLFWLTALPGLSGATLRIFYSFLVPIFGGRNWTVISTLTLLIPCFGLGLAVQNPETPYWNFVILALLAGFGGGNFASSMANISFFYPRKVKGTALGINAGLGNLGVSVLQFLAPFVILMSFFGSLGGSAQTQSIVMNGVPVHSEIFLQNVGFIWVVPILLVSIASFFFMNNLASARASFRDQAVIFRRKHNWIMCWLYVGTFGSFIGFSAALPMLIKAQFPDVNPLQYAFIGPFVGAAIRPLGGWLADKIGGARVTFWNFLIMTLATLGVLYFAKYGNFAGFLTLFVLLFAATGIGNGSTFRMIPIIFYTQHLRAAAKNDEAQAAAARQAGKEGAAVVGFSSAIAAYGMFLLPQGFNISRSLAGSLEPALYCFIAFYITCIVITWWFYSRRNAEVPC